MKPLQSNQACTRLLNLLQAGVRPPTTCPLVTMHQSQIEIQNPNAHLIKRAVFDWKHLHIRAWTLSLCRRKTRPSGIGSMTSAAPEAGKQQVAMPKGWSTDLCRHDGQLLNGHLATSKANRNNSDTVWLTAATRVLALSQKPQGRKHAEDLTEPHFTDPISTRAQAPFKGPKRKQAEPTWKPSSIGQWSWSPGAGSSHFFSWSWRIRGASRTGEV